MTPPNKSEMRYLLGKGSGRAGAEGFFAPFFIFDLSVEFNILNAGWKIE